MLLLCACTPAHPFVPESPKVDAAVQNIVEDELQHAIDDWKPEAAWAIVLREGEIIAVAGWDDGKTDAQIPLTRAIVTGSTLKPFTVAIALDEGAIKDTDTFDCRTRTYPGDALKDSEPHDRLTAAEILVTSSNVGASRIEDQLGLAKLEAGLKRFHFGLPPAPFPDEIQPGSYREGLFAAGELYAATPLQVARAYEALFADGYYAAPDGRNEAVSRETAIAVQDMLAEAIRSGTGEKAKIKNRKVLGKTGTAIFPPDQVYASFVGTVVDSSPETILVGLVAPKHEGNGPSAAAPVFARIAERLLGLHADRVDPDAER